MIKRIFGWFVFLLALLFLPRFLGIVNTNLFVGFALSALYAVSFNLLLSFTGLLSFGHALFYGSGAYATALALTHVEGLSMIPALLIGSSVSALIALIISPLLARVRGNAFAMLTLALGMLMFVVCLKFSEVTGGENGLAGYPIPHLSIPGIISIDMTHPFHFYYFAVVVVAASIFAFWFFTKTPLGSVMMGIRDNEMRVRYLGFQVEVTKAVIFIASGFFAGIAGAIYALFQGVVSTEGVLATGVSFFPIMATLIGGIGTFIGPIIGVGFLMALQQVTMRFTQQTELVGGLVFVLAILYVPGGIFWLWHVVKIKWKKRPAVQVIAEASGGQRSNNVEEPGFRRVER
ncbi:MAG: branched-chain amino acid ABC transporter permease [Deltaproteobacteria bacterium]|nr:MAG: branched-chain amino acid ABC transporter permease [Deltaproteobacteria bacterium]